MQPLAIQPAATNLPLLLDDISEYAVALCSQQNNRFHYEAPDQLPRQISVDGKRLQQVLLNLLSNAAKFTRDGMITLSVSAQPEGKACVLRFTVSDTGIGLDLDQGVDIFGAFQQVQAASGSAGLGLFITQRIVSAMGSSLSVTSVSGEGSSFSFELLTPVIGASSTGWSAFAPPERGSRQPLSDSSLPRNAMPEDQALNELAVLASQGHVTDIEHWIERYAHEAAYAPFIAQLRDLLEQFNFPEIQTLASRGRKDWIA
ncbi:ATP-binding protein [Ottowia sp. VDI28]|uniref:ATP-binding protein n=1 Tax=Ottowia sp. VDI28 TaxID=3133968 RepID=UPI003C2ED100